MPDGGSGFGRCGAGKQKLSASFTHGRLLVGADVQMLMDIGLLDQDATGHLTAPYDEIFIHADLMQAA